MGWFDWLFPKKQEPKKRVALTTGEPKPMPAGRVSFDTEATPTSNQWVVQPPADYESHWRMLDLDVTHLDVYSPKELLDMLLDLSPELSRAVWDFQRMCNPGWYYKIFELGDDDTINPEGQAHIDAFFERLRSEYGSVDIVIGSYFLNAYMRGAFCGELVLDGEARESIDLVAPDPYSIRFRKRLDPLRKEVWQPGQWQGSIFVPLDIPTFRYLPVDPAPANPYGRPLAAPSLYTIIFLLGMLHDVKRVIMQQGYKRMDIVLNTEFARDSFEYDQQGYATLGEYIQGAINAVKTVYAHLEPDDAFVHTDLFELGVPAGTIDSDSIGAINAIMERLEKMATRALKSNSLVMDTGNSPSETDSNRRWEIHAAGIKSLQHLCENMLESLLTLSLRAVGIQARVEFRFAELRASEMLRDEQTRAMRLQNNVGEYAAGFVSQNEASNNQVNHDADQATPRSPQGDSGMVLDNNDGSEALNQNSDDRMSIYVQETVKRMLEGIVDISEYGAVTHANGASAVKNGTSKDN